MMREFNIEKVVNEEGVTYYIGVYYNTTIKYG